MASTAPASHFDLKGKTKTSVSGMTMGQKIFRNEGNLTVYCSHLGPSRFINTNPLPLDSMTSKGTKHTFKETSQLTKTSNISDLVIVFFTQKFKKHV